jgi:hypothetical protein
MELQLVLQLLGSSAISPHGVAMKLQSIHGTTDAADQDGS